MFFQHVTGEFSVEVGGPWHCGPNDDSPKLLNYEVLVEYQDSALDEHGFLVDNLEFKRYFNSLGYTEDSCELMAKKAAEHFCRVAHKADWVYVNICVPGLACIKFKRKPGPDLDLPPLAAQLQGDPLRLEDM